MKMMITKSDWGMEYLGDLPQRLREFSRAGFDGVEPVSGLIQPLQWTANFGAEKTDHSTVCIRNCSLPPWRCTVDSQTMD